MLAIDLARYIFISALRPLNLYADVLSRTRRYGTAHTCCLLHLFGVTGVFTPRRCYHSFSCSYGDLGAVPNFCSGLENGRA